MSVAVTRVASASASASPSPAKVPRERIVTLHAETDHCPHVLLRILGLVAQHGTVPLSIAAERNDEGQRLAVEIDTLPDHTMSVLLGKVETIVTVRRAEIAPPPRRAIP